MNILPPGVGYLTRLNYLDASNNLITNIPEEIGFIRGNYHAIYTYLILIIQLIIIIFIYFKLYQILKKIESRMSDSRGFYLRVYVFDTKSFRYNSVDK